MILNNAHLTQRLSVDDQAKEINRIKEAHIGEELFMASTKSDTDVIDTLLHLSGVRYHIGVADYTVRYIKV